MKYNLYWLIGILLIIFQSTTAMHSANCSEATIESLILELNNLEAESHHLNMTSYADLETEKRFLYIKKGCIIGSSFIGSLALIMYGLRNHGPQSLLISLYTSYNAYQSISEKYRKVNQKILKISNLQAKLAQKICPDTD